METHTVPNTEAESIILFLTTDQELELLASFFMLITAENGPPSGLFVMAHTGAVIPL